MVDAQACGGSGYSFLATDSILTPRLRMETSVCRQYPRPDGSPEAEHATAHAFTLARTGDATIHVPHVIGPDLTSVDLYSRETDEFRRQSEKRGREATVQIQERATDLGLDAVRAVHEGPVSGDARVHDRC